jgi:uncharacterized protein
MKINQALADRWEVALKQVGQKESSPSNFVLHLLWRALIHLDRGARRVLLFGVHGYQNYLGWLMGGRCRFVPSCSHYAEEALVKGPLIPAVWLILWRLLRCQPLCRPGMDPVPEWLGGGEWEIRLDGKGHCHHDHDDQR